MKEFTMKYPMISSFFPYKDYNIFAIGMRIVSKSKIITSGMILIILLKF